MNADSIRRESRGKSHTSTEKAGVNTPAKKPRKDFPLSIHKGTGYWCKKVRGRVFYFGKVADDPKGVAALEEWLDDKDDLLAGREPRAKTDGLTVEDLCFRFLAHKEAMRDNGELNPRTYQGYHATAETTAKTFDRNRVVVDLVPDDFRKLRAKLAETRDVVALRNEMQRVRSIFKFAFDEGLIVAPIRFGQAFAKPKMDVVRRVRESHRSEHGDRMFSAADLRLVLEVLNGKEVTLARTDEKTGEPVKIQRSPMPAMKAMLLLAANCGFGQTDLANLPTRVIDLDGGWLDFARVKTAVRRRVPLWPETIEAIRDWIAVRSNPKDPADAGLLFITKYGQRWVKLNKSGSPADALGQEFAKVLTLLDLKRPGVSFYAMRHGFETIAGETTDQVAVDAIMGHVPQGMAGVYRERIGDDRLRRVVEHVRQWLFAEDAPDDSTPDRTPSESSDPSAPSNPPRENVGKRGGAKRKSVRKSGAQGAVEDSTTIWIGSHGPQGSHETAPVLSEDGERPSLRLYVG